MLRTHILTVLSLSLLPALRLHADPIVEVVPSVAPNAFGSPSWDQYAAHAVNSLENNLGNIGNRSTDPTAYEIAPEIRPNEIIVTSFPSWNGVANPAPPFHNEKGNRLHFGLHILGDGTKIRPSNIEFNFDSGDPNDLLDFAGDLSGFDFSNLLVGIDYGPDGIKGTADDFRHMSGPATALVDELVFVGRGNALWPVPDPGQSNEDAIAEAIDLIDDEPFMFINTYDVLDDFDNLLASGTGSVEAIPEPSGLLLAACAALVLWGTRFHGRQSRSKS